MNDSPKKVRLNYDHQSKEAELKPGEIVVISANETAIKRHYCYFCGNSSTQLFRHIKYHCKKAVDSEERKKLLNTALDPSLLKKVQTLLKNKGDHRQNIKGTYI